MELLTELLAEIYVFLRDVITSWAGIIGIVSAITECSMRMCSTKWITRLGKPLKWLAMACIPIAIFLAWQQQYRVAEEGRRPVINKAYRQSPSITRDDIGFNYADSHGLQYAYKRHQPVRDDLPFTTEVRIRSANTIQPFSVTVVCDTEIGDVEWWVNDVSAEFQQIKDWVVPSQRHLYRLAFQSPRLDSMYSVIILLHSRYPLKVKDVLRPSYSEAS